MAHSLRRAHAQACPPERPDANTQTANSRSTARPRCRQGPSERGAAALQCPAGEINRTGRPTYLRSLASPLTAYASTRDSTTSATNPHRLLLRTHPRRPPGGQQLTSRWRHRHRGPDGKASPRGGGGGMNGARLPEVISDQMARAWGCEVQVGMRRGMAGAPTTLSLQGPVATRPGDPRRAQEAAGSC